MQLSQKEVGKLLKKYRISMPETHILSSSLHTAQTILEMHMIKDYSFVLQETARGHEVIMGMKRDRAFGPVIIFGLGGIFDEVIKDVSTRIAPLTKEMAAEMIEEIKGAKILRGYRNTKPANKEKHIQEIDFNPVIANEKEAVVVDARMITDA